MSTWSLTNRKSVLSDNRVTNISKSFAYKMAAKTGWHRYGTKLRHCHSMYRTTNTFDAGVVRCSLLGLFARRRTVCVREEPVRVAVATAVNKPTTVVELRVVVVAHQWVGALASISSQLADLCRQHRCMLITNQTSFAAPHLCEQQERRDSDLPARGYRC